MDLPTLGRQFEDGGYTTCPIDGKEFVPLDFLERIISKENVKGALGIKDGVCVMAKLRKPPALPGQVAGQAKRIFAALVLMDKVAAIQGLLDEGLTDEHLPLTRDRKYDALLSHDSSKTFLFAGWSRQSVTEFIRYKQWLFLAPVLDTSGQLIKVDHECALPFTDSKVIGNGAAGIVHWAKLHQAHQRGFEVCDLICESNL